MTNFKKQLVSAAAAGAMLLNVAMPAFAGTSIVISGNGSGSDNWTTVNQISTTTVTQSNTANVTNNVDADAKTGGNDANFNTGGSVTINTGDAKTDVNVSNNLNSNTASVDCCASGDTKVEISGNGAKSDNGVLLNQITTTSVTQNNAAKVKNNVDADAKTGGNDAGYNTGGDVTVKTGNATSKVDVSTMANVNSAVVGGGLGGSNPSASFIISGNGAGSDNYITAVLVNTTAVTQNNTAEVKNNVDADAKTGDNDANFNTGGDVTIKTGNAKTDVDIDNAVNFNHADVDCGCAWDVLAKITGNGAEGHHFWWWDKPDNIIDLTLVSTQLIGQENGAKLTNNVDEDAKTGNNEASKNTGDPQSDPSVVTGNATSESDVNNSGNVNVVGSLPFGWPSLPDLPNFEFSFSFAALLAFFGLSV